MNKLYEDPKNKPFSITLADLKYKLARQYDETTICDLLGLDSDMILERFSDVVQEKFDQLVEEVYDEEELEEEDDPFTTYDQDH